MDSGLKLADIKCVHTQEVLGMQSSRRDTFMGESKDHGSSRGFNQERSSGNHSQENSDSQRRRNLWESYKERYSA